MVSIVSLQRITKLYFDLQIKDDIYIAKNIDGVNFKGKTKFYLCISRFYPMKSITKEIKQSSRPGKGAA